MGRYICYYEGLFFEWSTVCDAPVTCGMNRKEFEEYYQDQYGKRGMEELPARLERAIAQGTSSMLGHTLEELIETNRAGPNEGKASFKEIMKQIGWKE